MDLEVVMSDSLRLVRMTSRGVGIGTFRLGVIRQILYSFDETPESVVARYNAAKERNHEPERAILIPTVLSGWESSPNN